jgi:tight adherence protein B
MVALFGIVTLFLVTFVAGAVAVALGWFFLRRRSQSQHGEAPAEASAELEDSPVLLKEEALSTISIWARLLASLDFVPKMKVPIAEAGLSWSVGRVTALMLLTAALSYAALNKLSWLPGLVQLGASAAAGWLPYQYVLRRRSARFAMFEEQFPDALDFLSRALRAGHPLPVSLEMLASEAAPPLAIEIRKTCDERQLGMRTEQALGNLLRRVPLMDVSFFVAAVQLHSRTGGRLGEVLERLAETMRERFALKGEIRSITAHGRLTGLVLTLMPLVVAVCMTVVNPSYLGILAGHPYGKLLIAASVVSLTLAHFVIRRIVNIRV